jgi:hypothetical protein
MRLIDGDAVKERFKNDISGMEEQKEKETNLLDRMETMSQLSFARYAYAVSIKEPTVPAITLDRIEEARDEIENLEVQIQSYHNDNPMISQSDVLDILDKLIAEAERE